MLPIKGVFKDYNENKHPQDFAWDVRNGVVYKGLYINEEGTELHSQEISDNNLTPLCILPVKDGNKVIFCIRPDGDDEIGILHKDGTYESRLVADLGFDIDYPIDAEAQYNYKNELITAFTDGLNTPKVINLDDIQLPFDIKTIEMFSTFEEPKIDTEILEGAGSLKSDVYYIFVRYKGQDESVLTPSILTNPIFIVTSRETEAFNSFTGSKSGDPTTKGIKISISNVDTTYDKIQIISVVKSEGVLNPVLVSEIDITGPTAEYVYTGNELFTDITLSEVTELPIYYKTIKHLTQIDGTLYGASVTEEEPVNLQALANQIELKWISTPKNIFEMAESDKTHPNNNKERTYGHGEVYGFYIKFNIEGKWTEAFHIPGRTVQPLPTSLGVLPLPNLVGQENDLNQDIKDNNSTTFVDYDLQINPNSRYFQIRDTSRNFQSDGDSVIGDFGYWENDSEVYPDTPEFVGLVGQKVRHHKFPSSYAMTAFYKSRGGVIGDNFLKTFKDTLGVFISNMPTLPSNVSGYELLYAERNSSNSITVGNGIAYSSAVKGPRAPSEWTSDVRSSCGNIAVNISSGGTPQLLVPQRDNLRIYASDILKYKPVLPTYLESVGYINVSNTPLVGVNSLSRAQGTSEEDTIGFTAEGAAPLGDGKLANISVSFGSPNSTIRPITDTRYMPQNTLVSGYDNRGSEEVINAKISGFLEGTGISTMSLYVEGYDGVDVLTFGSLNGYTIALQRLCTYRTNIYTSVFSQKLVSTGEYRLIGEYEPLYGGDFFIGLDSVVNHTKLNLIRQGTRTTDIRVRVLVTYITESVINLGMRYEDLVQEGSKFYPKQNIEYTPPVNTGDPDVPYPLPGLTNNTWFMLYKEDVIYNFFSYNNDFNSINNIRLSIIYDSRRTFIGEDLYKIVRSNVYSKEERNPSWKRWSANDYYIIPRNKGEITNIQGIGNNLYINTKATLFITQGNDVLSTNETEVTVGAGDIFSRPLRELILDDQGYTGCQHKYSCLLFVNGYFFIDAEKGRVFMADGQTVRDIGTGMVDYFRNNLSNEIDNPFKGFGYTVGWDDKYGRIVLSKISGDSFTWSYTVNMKSWTSWHDYRPNYLYNDRDDIYAVKNKEIFVHNRENYGQYYRDEVKPFHIVGIINEGSNIDKLLSNLNWNTQVNLTDGELLRDKTFDELLIWNRYQSTGIRPLPVYSSIRGLIENQEVAVIRRAKSIWNYNKIRDLVEDNRLPFIDGVNSIESNINRDKPFELRRRLIDTFFVYKLLFNNQKITNLNQVELSPKIEVIDIGWKIKPVTR